MRKNTKGFRFKTTIALNYFFSVNMNLHFKLTDINFSNNNGRA